MPVEGANDKTYQTKDFELPQLNRYEIREDGSLWLQVWENKDGGLKPTDHWIAQDCTMGINFYTTWTDREGWIEWSSYFVKGQLKELHLISHETE